ncbi:MAG: hypothetical protein JOZ80_05230 [Acidobacteriaceae bacterium]|nr:hypothetical protein [Acidobacteriaceae bacterium]
MPRKLPVLTLAFCFFFSVFAQSAAARDLIPAGTILQCTIDEPNFSSKTAMVGDPLLCHLSSLRSFGHSVFPRGAMLSGHLQDYKDPGHFVGKGWIQLEFDRIILPGAQELPLTTKIISAPHMKVDKQGDIRGRGHPTRDAVEWMIPPLWPIKVVTLPARGPFPTLKGETRVSLRLMEDIELPFPTARNSVPMPPWATPSSYGYSGALASPQPVIRPSTVVQPASYTQPVAATPVTTSGSAPQMTVIALRGGAAYLAREYWIQNGEMHCVSATGAEQSLPLEKIDIGETVRVNQERNVDFVLQSRDVIEQ